MKKSNDKTKKVTIDDLALMVARGFADTHAEFKNRFDGIDVRLDGIDARLDDIDNRLGKIENNHERRLENLEDKFRIISTVFERDLKIKLPR